MSDLFFNKKKVTIFSIVFSGTVALLLLFLKKWTWSTGVLLGTGAGLCNFYLLYKDFTGMLQPPDRPRPSQPSLVSKFFFRYLILALLFVAAFYIPGVHFIGFALGFFLVHLNLGIVTFIRLLGSGPKK